MALARGPWRTASASGRVLLARVWQRYCEDRIADQSAKLSFYFLLSVFPLLALLTSIAGLVPQGSRTRCGRSSRARAGSSFPSRSRERCGRPRAGPPRRSKGSTSPVRQYRTWWRRNLLAVGLTLAAAWSAAQYAFALGLLLLGFNVLYIVGPNVLHHRWYWLMPGTVAGVILWLLASWGFKTYLRYFDHYSATYGSIGAVIVLMMWFYLSGIAILLGAEFNSEIEKAMSGGSAGAAKE